MRRESRFHKAKAGPRREVSLRVQVRISTLVTATTETASGSLNLRGYQVRRMTVWIEILLLNLTRRAPTF